MTVRARYGKLEHIDKFDPLQQFSRTKFRNAIVAKFAFPDDDDAHSQIESLVIGACAEADSTPSELWTPNLVRLEQVQQKSVRWFWPLYFPEGAYTVLDSDPGEGKSTISIDIAARYSRGDSMPPHSAPNGTCDSGNVLLLNGEDDLQRTVKPRLAAAGANMDRVRSLRTVSIDGEDERFLQLPGDISILEKVITEHRIGFVVVDVLSAFTQDGDSLNDEGAMRRMASRLADVLERTRATALLLRHLNKKENLRGMYRGGGSIAIVAAARAAFAIGPHPDEPGVKVLSAIKHNLGPKPPSLTYAIEAAGDTSRVVWTGQTDLTAADVLGGSKSDSSGKVEQAKEIIADILASGARGSNEVEGACDQAGISKATYWRARKALKVHAEKTEFGGGQWLLSLPKAFSESDETF
jgi:hypothetical protein